MKKREVKNKSKFLKIIKWIPLIILLVSALFVYFSKSYNYLNIPTLREKQILLQNLIHNNPVSFPIVFMLIYAVITALCLPITFFLTLISGFLFLQPLATIYVIIGATAGGAILFLSAKTVLKDFYQKNTAPFFEKIKENFSKYSLCYLFFLHFVPFFPFWLLTIGFAFFQVSFFTFLWTTAIGIIPVTYAFTQGGAGLGAIIAGEEFTFANIFNIHIQIALALLLILGIVSIFMYIWWKKKKKN